MVNGKIKKNSMISKYKQYKKGLNETIRNKMTPKSEKEIEDAINGDGIDKVYHVYSGLDAFEYTTDKGEKMYLPYVAIIAKSELDAKIKTAKLLGQDLFDQETNMDYENYVSDAQFKYNF